VTRTNNPSASAYTGDFAFKRWYPKTKPGEEGAERDGEERGKKNKGEERSKKKKKGGAKHEEEQKQPGFSKREEKKKEKKEGVEPQTQTQNDLLQQIIAGQKRQQGSIEEQGRKFEKQQEQVAQLASEVTEIITTLSERASQRSARIQHMQADRPAAQTLFPQQPAAQQPHTQTSIAEQYELSSGAVSNADETGDRTPGGGGSKSGAQSYSESPIRSEESFEENPEKKRKLNTGDTTAGTKKKKSARKSKGRGETGGDAEQLKQRLTNREAELEKLFNKGTVGEKQPSTTGDQRGGWGKANPQSLPSTTVSFEQLQKESAKANSSQRRQPTTHAQKKADNTAPAVWMKPRN
jgi:hypothetical protein